MCQSRFGDGVVMNMVASVFRDFRHADGKSVLARNVYADGVIAIYGGRNAVGKRNSRKV